MNADGTNPINLTQSPAKLDSASSWSPDGKQIAFTSAEPLKWNNGLRWNIWVMEADGGNPRDLTNHDAEDRSPDWSPDGKQIAFASDRNRDWEFENNVIGNWEVFVMSVNGANPINLTNHLATDDSPDWSPDGKRIAFVSNRDENSRSLRDERRWHESHQPHQSSCCRRQPRLVTGRSADCIFH